MKYIIIFNGFKALEKYEIKKCTLVYENVPAFHVSFRKRCFNCLSISKFLYIKKILLSKIKEYPPVSSEISAYGQTLFQCSLMIK